MPNLDHRTQRRTARNPLGFLVNLYSWWREGRLMRALDNAERPLDEHAEAAFRHGDRPVTREYGDHESNQEVQRRMPDALLPPSLRPRMDAKSLIEPTDIGSVPPLEFVVAAPFHIARGTVTTIFGLGGVGKSSLAVALGAHIALGKDFLGAATTKGRVFYGEFEGAGQLLARTTRKVLAALREDDPSADATLDANFKQKHFTAREKAEWGYARGMIPALIEQLGNDYDVVIFDSYEGATLSDPTDPQVAAELMMLFARLATETNTAVILIDHAPKHNRNSVFGSTKKTDFARVVINVESADDNGGRLLKLHSTKCNVAPKPTFPVVERRESESALRFCVPSGLTVNLAGLTDSSPSRIDRLVRRALEQGASTRTAVYEFIQVEEGLQSTDAARKRVQRAGLSHLLPEAQNGRRAS